MAQMTESRRLDRQPSGLDPRGQSGVLLNRRQWAYIQHLHRLTPRETQVAQLLCRGLENGPVARHLGISPGTVKTHVRNIYRKVGISSRIAMLLRFVSDAKSGS